MKICVAQIRPAKGDIGSNIDKHKKLIDLAVSNGADIIVFPELSLTGYEPALAEALATTQDDSRFDGFQIISDAGQIIIGVGVPTKTGAGICISMVVFQPGQPRQTYSKKHLHADEEPFFVSGQNLATLKAGKTDIALAICYELSIPEHPENAFRNGAEVYIASVAKSAGGVEKSFPILSGIARQYSMTVLMSNCTGPCADGECAGKTAIWHSDGLLAGQLNGTDEGILMIDRETRELTAKTV